MAPSCVTVPQFTTTLHDFKHRLRIRSLVASSERGNVLPSASSRHIDVGQMFPGRDPASAPRMPKRTLLLGHLRSALRFPEPLRCHLIPKGPGGILHGREHACSPEPRALPEYAI